MDYGNMVYEHEKTRTNLLSIYNGNILKYEVRIIEEDKKIEKLDVENDGNTITLYNNAEWTILNNVDVIICNKINEIIDKLNEEK